MWRTWSRNRTLAGCNIYIPVLSVASNKDEDLEVHALGKKWWGATTAPMTRLDLLSSLGSFARWAAQERASEVQGGVAEALT